MYPKVTWKSSSVFSAINKRKYPKEIDMLKTFP